MTLTRDRKAELLSAAPPVRRRRRGGHGPDRRRSRSRSTSRRTTSSPARARSGPGFFVIVERRRSGWSATARPIATLGPGDFFGELSVLDGKPRNAQVVADGPTTCLALASWDFEAVLLEEPKVALAILRDLAAPAARPDRSRPALTAAGCSSG